MRPVQFNDPIFPRQRVARRSLKPVRRPFPKSKILQKIPGWALHIQTPEIHLLTQTNRQIPNQWPGPLVSMESINQDVGEIST